ncbi:hypothetical protein D3C72_1537690 [compost metagenome]
MSANIHCRPCLRASASPPTWRCLAQSTAHASAASLMPRLVAATSRRLLSSTFIAVRKPLPSGPSRLAAGTKQSSATSCAGAPRMPISFSAGATSTPALCRSTTKALMPRVPAAGSVLA